MKEAGTNNEMYTSIRMNKKTFELQDTLSGAILATCRSVVQKQRLIELYNPDHSVEFKSTGLIQLEWSFKHDNETYSWKRDILGMGSGDKGYSLWMDRNPDPNWCIAIYRPKTKKSTANVQILDYNLSRIFIEDKRGLEIMIIATLCALDGVHSSANDAADPSPNGSPAQEFDKELDNRKSIDPASDYETEEDNLILVSERGSAEIYVERCLHLLADPALLFVKLRSIESEDGGALAVANVVKVAALVKTARWKNDGEELKQYTVPDEQHQLPHKRVLVLDAPTNNPSQYRPPKSLTIYLSRTELDELLPKRSSSSSYPTISSTLPPPVPSPPLPSGSSKPTTPPTKPTKPPKIKKEEKGKRDEGVKLNFWGRRKS
ncbi:hypothetical protein BT69DRAFT_1286371 [Atractiella rhizophila]|nr:hypothetical protein BT69DRAFT_1286371 [Atractiella rhizophila]